jgi:indole-3-glycerol phosphate synthase
VHGHAYAYGYLHENSDDMSTDILSQIVDHKKIEIAEAEKQIPRADLLRQLEHPRKKRLFFENLTEPGPFGINIIAEIKRASPSKGVILEKLDPEIFAAAYTSGGAAAISILTDQRYFKGCLEDLIRARKATHLPVLRKDFLVSAYQLYESAVAGADAVLLIVRILQRQQLKDYLSLCRELNLDALVEAYTPEDLEIADWAGARLVGINNRNLSSFDTDVSHAGRMSGRLNKHQVAVAASGIEGPRDIQRLVKAGIWNFLIGEHIVRSENPAAFIRTLLDSTETPGR